MRSPDSLTNQGRGWFGEEGRGHSKEEEATWQAALQSQV